jgi:hypothetical protein
LKSLIIEKTLSTPGINFDSATGLLKLEGESYPENAAKFYAPILKWIEEYFATEAVDTTIFEFAIIYFNSSTSKIFMSLFDDLEALVAEGSDIKVRWICHAHNETAIECGEEFKEDLAKLSFDIVIMED